MSLLPLIPSLLVSVLVGRWLFGLIFDDWQDFCDCLRLSFTPDLISMFRGEYFEDLKQSFKLSIYLFAVIGSGALTYFGVGSLLKG